MLQHISLDGRHAQPRIIEVRSQSLSKTSGKTRTKRKKYFVRTQQKQNTEYEKRHKGDNTQWNSLDQTAVEQHSSAIKYNA